MTGKYFYPSFLVSVSRVRSPHSDLKSFYRKSTFLSVIVPFLLRLADSLSRDDVLLLHVGTHSY